MKYIKTILLIASVALFINDLYAVPRFALRLGDSCSDCHVNPTGGAMRNIDGWYYGRNLLSMISTRDKEFKISPQLTENISLGLDYRTQYLYSQEKERTDFQEMTGSIYTNVDIGKNISVFARYDFVNFIWEGYGVARILPNEGYIKVGTFQPNFGIRLDDHTAYTRGGDFALLATQGIREGLLYDPFYVETGVELGLNPTDYSNFTFSVGKSKNNRTFRTDPTYTTRLELNPRLGKLGFLLGGSGAITHIPHRASMFGGFAGIGYEQFALMAEYDISEDFVGKEIKSNFTMLQASYQIMVGLEAIARYDRIDPNDGVDDDEISRMVFGFEFTPYSFIEIRPQYRIVSEEPKVDNNAFVLQFHLWY